MVRVEGYVGKGTTAVCLPMGRRDQGSPIPCWALGLIKVLYHRLARKFLKESIKIRRRIGCSR
jgi:hypothetical protein